MYTPEASLLLSEQVRLVEQQQRSLSWMQLRHVSLEVRTLEEQRVPRVEDLHDEVAALEHAPQLLPDEQVLLVGRQHE